jgi:two-component system response regulator HydG
LYYRLYVVAIRMPPLRERTGDIPLLIRHFLDAFSRQNGKHFDGITPDALDLLTGHDWPGNIRELRNVIERMVVMARGGKLTVRDVPLAVREGGGRSGAPRVASALNLQDSERTLIVRALKATAGNRTEAARQLGISRRTLHRKLNEYDLRDV